MICTTSKLSDFFKYVCCDIVDFQVYKWFFMGDFSEENKEADNIIDIEDSDFEEIQPKE